MKHFPLSHQFIVFIAFVISGVAGLVYESVWSHYLGLYLGHAALAQTLTLAIFMGGMAVGAWFVGNRIDRFSNAVLIYAAVEAVLGVLGLVFHNVFDYTIHFSFESVFPALGSPLLINVVKWFIASLLILPQSILLGATFPLLTSGIVRRAGRSEGKMISMLYFTNSIGAAFGAIFATFILIPNMGMPGALLVAGMMNILVAIIVYYVAKTKEPVFKSAESQIESPVSENVSRQLILFIACLTGFASFVYEISWIRMLNLVLGTTLHSFEIMLSAFILGLALGGYWIRKRIDHIKNMVHYLGVIQILMGAFAILTMPLYVESFSWVAEILKNVLMTTKTGYSFYNMLTATLAILIMMPAAFFAGMTLPLLTMLLMRKGDNEKAIGKVYAFNTVGALLGVWFAIHIGMIFLGLKYLLIFGSLLDFMLGVILILKAKNKTRFQFSRLSPIGYLLVLAVVVFIADFSPKTLASGTYRYARDSFSAETKMLFYEDGKSASISVISEKTPEGDKAIVISTNGKPDAAAIVEGEGYSGDEPTMVLAGVLPLLTKPEAKKIANIGFGSGMTTHTLLGSENLESLDTIEIEPEMVEGAKFFGEKNARVYKDDRSTIIIDDAKTYFASHNKKYDVIVSEPSNPWVMGVGNLFTEQFYRHIKGYLKDGGILVQWLQLYEISPRVIATAFNAIGQEFEYFDLYRANSGDVIMLISDQPIPELQYHDFSQLPKLMQQDLKEIGISNLNLIKTRKVGTAETMRPLFRYFSHGVNSDYFPILSLKAPEDRFRRVNAAQIFQYEQFGLPIFEYLQNKEWNNQQLFSNYDKNHPYLDVLDRRYSFFQHIKNPETEIKFEVNINSLGHLSIVKSVDTYCGSQNFSDEERWVASLLNLLSNVAILGSDYGEFIMSSEYVVQCESISQINETKFIISLLRQFYNKNYPDVLQISEFLLSENTQLNTSVKKQIFNYALFSILQLQQQNKPLGIDHQEFLKNNNDLWLNHTMWLVSQIRGL